LAKRMAASARPYNFSTKLIDHVHD